MTKVITNSKVGSLRQAPLLSWELTCAAHCAEVTNARYTAQVWTCAQVVRCGVICLSTVRNLIHRLLVYQSKAALGTTSHIWIDAQFASARKTMYIVKSASRCGSLGASLFPALSVVQWHCWYARYFSHLFCWMIVTILLGVFDFSNL